MKLPTPPVSRSATRRTTWLAGLTAITLTASGCSLSGSSDDEGDSSTTESSQGAEQSGAGSSQAREDAETITLVTHESFTPPEGAMEAFTQESGHEVEVVAVADAGTLTNQLVLTSGSPLGDVVFGIDNTFATRAVDEGVFAPMDVDLPEGAENFVLSGEAGEQLAPIDYGDVCVNIDDAWFEEEGIEPPQELADLTEPQYEGLFVTPGASTSSPGMAFLLATIGAFDEDGWQEFWSDLMANDAKITAGWSDAYSVDFTAGGGDGDRPIVLSYASSPPATIPEGGQEPTTSALLDTCFRQVEYAGVLEGAENPEAGAELVEFLLTPEFQAGLPESMYVYPVSQEVELPEQWAQFAAPAPEPIEMDPTRITEQRDQWLGEWSEVTGQ